MSDEVISKSQESPQDADAPEAPSSSPQFITRLASIEEQVGVHVIHALQQENNVAVVTTVVPGVDGGQYIVSVGLDAEIFARVQHVLEEANEALPRVPCVGFHCFLPTKDKPDGPS